MKINWGFIKMLLGVIYLALVALSGGAFSLLSIYYAIVDNVYLTSFDIIMSYILSALFLFLAVKSCLRFEVKIEEVEDE